jgi:hypothetical protein
MASVEERNLPSCHDLDQWHAEHATVVYDGRSLSCLVYDATLPPATTQGSGDPGGTVPVTPGYDASPIRSIQSGNPPSAPPVFVRELLAAKGGPYRGGPHSQTQKPWGDGLESHHMPAKSVSGLGEPNGPAIQMTPADHARTMSNGKMQGSGEYREMIGDMISGGDMRGAMATEIRDVRRVAREVGDPRRYNEAMREMMDYSRSQGYIPINPQTVVPRTR